VIEENGRVCLGDVLSLDQIVEKVGPIEGLSMGGLIYRAVLEEGVRDEIYVFESFGVDHYKVALVMKNFYGVEGGTTHPW